MQIVRFNRAVYPHRIGDMRVLPDDVAAALIALGDASHYEDWPVLEDTNGAKPQLHLPFSGGNAKPYKTKAAK